MDGYQTAHTEVTSTTQPRLLASAGSKLSYTELSAPHSTSAELSMVTTSSTLVIQEGEDHFFENDARLPYKLIRNLGHGHSAIVEMVEDVNTGSVFARKVFRIRGSRDEGKRIFNNEIKIIRRLAPHHHVIRVFATYVTNRELGLILHPVADGGDLEIFLEDFKEAKAVRRVQPEKIKILKSSFGCLASGLSFMHRQKIRHKDIKPRNILIHKGSMIYADFGYSFDHSALGQGTTTGRPHTFTRKYCAPEVSDWGPRNSKSDIFSLGCVFLEILLALHEELVPPDPYKPYYESLEDGRVQSSLNDLNRLGTIASDMLHHRPQDRYSADAITSELWHHGVDHFCAKCKAGELEANFPIMDPRQYFLAVVQSRLAQVLREWEYLVRTLEYSIEQYHSGAIEDRAEDLKETSDRNLKTMELLHHLLAPLSEMIKAWEIYNSVEGDISYFSIIEPSPDNFSVYQSLHAIKETFENLENLQQKLLDLEKSCQNSAQVLQLRLAPESDEAAHHNGVTTGFTISVITSRALATRLLSVPTAVLPFKMNSKPLIITIFITMVVFRMACCIGLVSGEELLY